MQLFVGITDSDWYHQLSQLQSLDEVNFWRPSPKVPFKALQEGELFLFKLHSPNNFIVGGGFFSHYQRLPIWLAWEVFEMANGANSYGEMLKRVQRYRRAEPTHLNEIGCIVLLEPFFFPPDEWIPAPSDFAHNIVQGKGYSTSETTGKQLWESVGQRLAGYSRRTTSQQALVEGVRFGEPQLVNPRLGQGTFRILITEAYQHRCVVTGERTLPVLEAAHIKPYSAGGPHEVENGLLLRSDLHRLFDRGYLTVDPQDRRLLISKRIHEEYQNGKVYYALHGRRIREPDPSFHEPNSEYLQWHAENVFIP